MAKIEFQLEHGLPFGKGKDREMQYDVVLRELNGKDVIDASLEAEKVTFISTSDGGVEPVAYTSNILLGY